MTAYVTFMLLQLTKCVVVPGFITTCKSLVSVLVLGAENNGCENSKIVCKTWIIVLVSLVQDCTHYFLCSMHALYLQTFYWKFIWLIPSFKQSAVNLGKLKLVFLCPNYGHYVFWSVRLFVHMSVRSFVHLPSVRLSVRSFVHSFVHRSVPLQVQAFV